ncbi:Farnesyl diphosphate synthase [Pirellula sp. SH-Sr6A]|uniref:polyprenyl synthetase family protein n=1 Tax=Pirellula sp. SH-Sr6A TaxID=1632865 RepID=UPI00078C4183|nr:farnesyl diphosphate synthase [Pirellula sp. SH-Sr6A]AMV34121.1 Farnesyl diphosphate synthase [Pirellula sp. SH-Sr6A]
MNSWIALARPPGVGWKALSRGTFFYSATFLIENHQGTIIATATAIDPLQERWKHLAGLIDQALETRIAGLSEDCPDRLRDSMRYSLLGPGKRLRPVLCLLACETLGGTAASAIPSAIALEMIHCYSLIHDDLPAMDDDDLRRGRPTCHIQFDEATAILAGDGLQALAFQTLMESEMSPSQQVQSLLVLAKAAGPEGMVAGQVDDLWAEKHGGDGRLLQSIHARKTGAMIRGSVELGGIAAGASEKDLRVMSQYGDAIGIAFQIADDLLDVESTAENTGKRTGKDQERGKLTYPSIYGVEDSRAKARELVLKAVRLVEPYGAAAVPLQQLAKYIIDRSH